MDDEMGLADAAYHESLRGRNSAFEPREAGRQACPERFSSTDYAEFTDSHGRVY